MEVLDAFGGQEFQGAGIFSGWSSDRAQSAAAGGEQDATGVAAGMEGGDDVDGGRAGADDRDVGVGRDWR